MPTTAIPDVAKLAVVSISTVSRMYNGRNRVHPQTRPRIRTAIRQLDYEQIAPPTHWLSTCRPGTITGASPVSPTPPPRQPTAVCIPQLGELNTTRLADATAKRWMYD